MQQILLNIIPFKPINNKLTFAFYGEKIPGGVSIKWDKLFDEFPEGRDPMHKSYYSDFKEAGDGAIIKEIDVFNAIKFTQHYYRYLILNYFKTIEGVIVFPNFTDDVEVWFEDETGKDENYKLYNKFTIKVQYKNVANEGYELMIAYDGTSKIWRKSIGDITDFDTTLYNLVNCNGTIYKYEKMPEDVRQNLQTLYPVLNNTLKKEWHLEEEFKKENRYPIYLNHIQNFYKTYINTTTFKKIFNISPNGFYIVPENKIFHTSDDANELQFLKGTHINPGLGIILHKPLKAFTENHVKLFFIYYKDDGEFIKDTFYEYITNGWHKPVKDVMKHTKNLQGYINQPLSIDASKRIVFNNTDTIFEEVKQQFDSFTKAADTTYVAVYISPVSKADKDHPQHNAYYKIKELLLNKEISSQVVYKEHLDKEDFYYFLPNIYVAMLAKIGGIPWRLARSKEDEIIIGVGAFKPQHATHRFLGSAFCFSNEGIFEGFDCFRDDEPVMLAGSIRDAVQRFIDKNNEAKRVIIHFYKEISDRKELKPILKMLGELGTDNIPVIVVTINKTDSNELMGFDMKSPGKMPISGRYVSVGFNKYLLFNNIRYSANTNLLPKDYHFPVKISIRCTQEGIIDNPKVLRELIDQVYQFSRMYWKSISQQNLPVTTRYSEMVAEIYPHFENEHLPEFGKKNLWFL